jgi:hypothetical protein
MQESLDAWGFILRLLLNPSPWVGGLIGAGLTGLLFGWISYLRSIRPIVIIYRKIYPSGNWLWHIANIGPGVAFHVRIRDLDDHKRLVRAARLYPVPTGEDRPLKWLKTGTRIEVDYRNAFGRRAYKTSCQGDTNHFAGDWFRRKPTEAYFKDYIREIDLPNERTDFTDPLI